MMAPGDAVVAESDPTGFPSHREYLCEPLSFT